MVGKSVGAGKIQRAWEDSLRFSVLLTVTTEGDAGLERRRADRMK